MTRSPVPWHVRQAASDLRKKLPPAHPVIVKVGQTSHPLSAADIGLRGRRFIITFDPGSMHSEREWLEALAHEWAHALCWALPSQQDHDAAWGVQYARCYCIAFGVK